MIEAIIKLVAFIFKVLTSDITWGIIIILAGGFLIVYSIYTIIVIIIDSVRYGFKNRKEFKETVKGIIFGIIEFIIGIVLITGFLSIIF